MKRFIILFFLISTYHVSGQKIKILQDAIFVEYGKSISSLTIPIVQGLISRIYSR